MSKTTTVVKSRGIGFAGLLTILFIGLKLLGHISWSWLWVLAPLWISAAIAFTVFLVVAIGILTILYLSNK